MWPCYQTKAAALVTGFGWQKRAFADLQLVFAE
jgi:hypothetical protein